MDHDELLSDYIDAQLEAEELRLELTATVRAISQRMRALDERWKSTGPHSADENLAMVYQFKDAKALFLDLQQRQLTVHELQRKRLEALRTAQRKARAAGALDPWSLLPTLRTIAIDRINADYPPMLKLIGKLAVSLENAESYVEGVVGSAAEPKPKRRWGR